MVVGRHFLKNSVFHNQTICFYKIRKYCVCSKVMQSVPPTGRLLSWGVPSSVPWNLCVNNNCSVVLWTQNEACSAPGSCHTGRRALPRNTPASWCVSSSDWIQKSCIITKRFVILSLVMRTRMDLWPMVLKGEQGTAIHTYNPSMGGGWGRQIAVSSRPPQVTWWISEF